ncbi:MAG: quinone oxidoreductase family protein [Acidimicrobiales bacterium]
MVEALGGLPIVEEFADPTGDDVAEVVAAALNPFDLIVAAGKMPARQPSPPFIAGIEGIARLSDGTLSYFANPRLPYGSLAEHVPLAGADTATVPAGLDPAFAATLGVSGIAAWLSLTTTGRLTAGERVLILGAEGQVGQLATQLARLIGAAQVVGAVRADENRHVVLAHGADAAVSTADLDTLTERLRQVVGDGVDLILDLIWGPVIAHAIDVARLRARVVQVGNAAGATATLTAPVLRNKLVSILPHANWTFSAAERAAAFEQLAAYAQSGALRLDFECVPLDEAASAWTRLEAGTATRKLVIVP